MGEKERDDDGAPSNEGRRTSGKSAAVCASCGPICNFLPRASLCVAPYLHLPTRRHRASSDVPIKCCSPYKISPRRRHVLMNYRVRPRDRSNYIERRVPLNCPATTERGPCKNVGDESVPRSRSPVSFLPPFLPYR